jgi:hypothetical protein
MAFDGYLRLNTVEIANAARTKTYIENLLPTFGLVCPPCEGLEAALGETYTTPVADNAPWYDPSMPSSGAFYGFYPLEITGIDDSTRTAVSTELVGDGSVTNRPRFAGRDIRVNGVLIGATEQAIDTGLAWLNRALSGPCDGTDDCRGGDLDFYSSCPQVQDWSGAPILPIDSQRDGSSDEADLWDPSGDGETDGLGGDITFNPAVAGDYFTRQISGLIPGESYRFSLFGLSPTTVGVKVEIVDGAEFIFDFHHVFIGGVPADPTLAPLDFIAPSDTAFIRMTPWDWETDTASSTAFTVERITLQRTQIKATVLQTEYNDYGTPSGGWTADVPASTVAAPWQRDITESRVYTEVTSTAGTVSYPSGSGINLAVQNTGVRTRVTVVGEFSEDSYAGTVAPTVTDALNVETVYSAINTSLVTSVQFMVTVEFDFATAGTPATVQLSTTAATNVTVTSGAEWSVHYLLIEAVDEPLLIDDPNPGLALERVLRQVRAVTGPTTVERFAPPCGAMRRVTFGLRADVPFHYSTPSQVGTAFASEAVAMPEVECLFDQAVRMNYYSNPRYTTSATVSVAGFTTITPGVDATTPAGRRVVLTGGTTTGTINLTTSVGAVQPFVEDAPYTFGVFLRQSSTTAATITSMTLTLTGDYTVITTVDEPVTIPGDSGSGGTQFLYPVQVTGLAPSGVTSAQLSIVLTRASGSGFTVTSPMLTFGTSIGGYDEPWIATAPHDLDYFDGTFPNAAWTGTADASSSILTPVDDDTVVLDPDCPVLPDPPAPPSIDDTCLTLPASWLRYTIDVPTRFVPVTASALPIATIVTDAALNNVRLRFYPASLGAFATCGFVGEMLMSYIPADSTVILDATQRTATLVRPGFSDQSVTHLLYGPNGGPIEWPSLTCGQEYIFTVDVEPTGDVSGSSVDLDMAVRF